jgi:hypothetical protein
MGPPCSIACTACWARGHGTGLPQGGSPPRWGTCSRARAGTGPGSCTAMRCRSCRGPLTHWSQPVARLVSTHGGRLDAKAPRPRWAAGARYDGSRLRLRGCGPSRPGRVPLSISTPGQPSARNWQHDASSARSVGAFVAIRPPLLPSLRRMYLSSACHRSFFESGHDTYVFTRMPVPVAPALCALKRPGAAPAPAGMASAAPAPAPLARVRGRSGPGAAGPGQATPPR